MASYNEGPTKTYPVSAAIAQYLRVITPASLAVAGALDRELGTTENPTFAALEPVAVRLRTAGGTAKFVASGAISSGDRVFGAASGKVSATANGNYIGIAQNATTADGDVIEIMRDDSANGMLYRSVAASAAVTNDTAETAFDKSFTIPANTLKVGDVIRARICVIATATNSTDTLTVKFKIGSQVIIATAALDVANSDVGYIDAELTIRTIGASGTFEAAGAQSIGPPASATLKPWLLGSTAIDTTAAQAVTVTATWSVANAGNSCRLDHFTLQRLAA